MTRLNFLIILIGGIIVSISFTHSIYSYKKMMQKKYLKNFFIAPLIAVLITLNTIASRILTMYKVEYSFIIQNILIAFDLLFWRFFFLSLLYTNRHKRWVQIFSGSVICLVTISLLFSSYRYPNLQIVALFNLCKSIFCILYFTQLFKNIPTQNIKDEPSFWIVTGLLFYTSLSIPFYALNDFLKSNTPQYISTNIFAISNILIIIMHLFFIKSYKCLTPTLKE